MNLWRLRNRSRARTYRYRAVCRQRSESEIYSHKEFGDKFLDTNRERFSQRAAQGWVRDGHGDLHCEHVCFAPEGIQIFDCIEFDPKLRCCDLASEIAFLAMDLEARKGGALVQPFLIRYLRNNGKRKAYFLVAVL